MKISLFSFLLVILLFLLVIESVRRGVLETKYSLVWIITCIFLGILSSNEMIINKLADYMDVYYPPSLLFLFGLLFAIMLIFDLTRRVSKLNKELTTLTQEHTILKQKFKKKEID
ncbi:DUF2304 domain-containing protein [Bacillus sp. FJAT-29790]|uniref:DUF2304 domain-containing protein n=1 Tax=Bacillus sp. FJAT-29790 TaxID=1895002 RepID=UPI001C2176A5|nr:DUF2304 domain-containing protein [Bacillus sp. FJAT-29790]MBU8881149.1 DUF2304 domain-containing protein [Bacillus sp. FJAT-29790]